MTQDKKKKRLKDVVRGVGDWERSQTSLGSLKNNQVYGEKRASEMLRIDQSSYRGRKKVDPRGDPDYVGPMGYGGSGTKDKMPGTTPSTSRSAPTSPPGRRVKTHDPKGDEAYRKLREHYSKKSKTRPSPNSSGATKPKKRKPQDYI
jgi:hypothetical protein